MKNENEKTKSKIGDSIALLLDLLNSGLLDSDERIIYSTVLSYTRAGQWCWISNKQFGGYINKHPNTASDKINKLEEEGWFEIHRNKKGNSNEEERYIRAIPFDIQLRRLKAMNLLPQQVINNDLPDINAPFPAIGIISEITDTPQQITDTPTNNIDTPLPEANTPTPKTIDPISVMPMYNNIDKNIDINNNKNTNINNHNNGFNSNEVEIVSNSSSNQIQSIDSDLSETTTLHNESNKNDSSQSLETEQAELGVNDIDSNQNDNTPMAEHEDLQSNMLTIDDILNIVNHSYQSHDEAQAELGINQIDSIVSNDTPIVLNNVSSECCNNINVEAEPVNIDINSIENEIISTAKLTSNQGDDCIKVTANETTSIEIESLPMDEMKPQKKVESPKELSDASLLLPELTTIVILESDSDDNKKLFAMLNEGNKNDSTHNNELDCLGLSMDEDISIDVELTDNETDLNDDAEIALDLTDVEADLNDDAEIDEVLMEIETVLNDDAEIDDDLKYQIKQIIGANETLNQEFQCYNKTISETCVRVFSQCFMDYEIEALQKIDAILIDPFIIAARKYNYNEVAELFERIKLLNAKTTVNKESTRAKQEQFKDSLELIEQNISPDTDDSEDDTICAKDETYADEVRGRLTPSKFNDKIRRIALTDDFRIQYAKLCGRYSVEDLNDKYPKDELYDEIISEFNYDNEMFEELRDSEICM